MKKDEIKIGKCYTAKVSGKMATVRIDAENPRGGWDATNLTTRKKIRVKSAQRLRHETRGPGKPTSDDVAKTVDAVQKGDLTKGITVPTGAKKGKKATKEPKAAVKRDTGERGGKAAKIKRPSGLDAAVAVLAEAGGPMGCKEMVERMLTTGLWKTTGKTPAATIYAAIIREIATKGDTSRFRKVGRGKFELVK